MERDGLKIALDLDGVLADATGNWLRLLRERFRIKLAKRRINEWDFWRKLGLRQEDFEEIFAEAWRRWDSIGETEANLSQKVEKLRSFGELDIVTGRSRETIRYATRWMEGKGISFGKIVLVDAYGPKAHLEYDVFIDDSPKHVSEAAARGKMALLYHQPWNRDVEQQENLVRIRSLHEASEIIEKRLNGNGS